MAIALRELERGRSRPPLRVVPAPMPHQPPRPPHQVYWRRRVLALAIAVLLVVAAVTAGRAVRGGRTEPAGRIQTTVVVAAGETLWDIAARYAPAGRDLNTWVAEVADANGVDAQQLQPGTPVVVPVESAHVPAVPLQP
jgi:LysM domain-containing protein